MTDRDRVDTAMKVDLLTYLQNYEPENLKHVSGGTFCTRDHESLRISNGKWYWFSQCVGGYNAVGYLCKVRGMTFRDAVDRVLGYIGVSPPEWYAPKEEPPKPKLFEMPELSSDTRRVREYLAGRGIAEEVTDYCVSAGLVAETKRYRNALFLGYDTWGKPRYGALRGTMGDFKGEVKGSDKKYSFMFNLNPHPGHIHLFESAIDALSFASLDLLAGNKWRQRTLLSLGGVYKSDKTLPPALERTLGNFPEVAAVHLHLDNDDTGRAASAGIAAALSGKLAVLDEPNPHGKDVNDELLYRLEHGKTAPSRPAERRGEDGYEGRV